MSTTPISSTSSITVESTYDIQVVQNIVAFHVNGVILDVFQAIAAGVHAKSTFPQMAEKHTVAFEEELNQAGESKQVIYKKVFTAVAEEAGMTPVERQFTPQELQRQSMIKLAIGMINRETGDANAGARFLGSFIWIRTGQLIEQLNREQPGATGDLSIWK